MVVRLTRVWILSTPLFQLKKNDKVLKKNQMKLTSGWGEVKVCEVSTCLKIEVVLENVTVTAEV